MQGGAEEEGRRSQIVEELLSSLLYSSLWHTGKTSVQWHCLLHMAVCYGESEHVVFRPQKIHACIRAAAHMSAFAMIRLKGGDNMSESHIGGTNVHRNFEASFSVDVVTT